MALGNKEVMAANIKKYMERKGVNATDVCTTLDIKHNTFSDWVNAKTYPRIDKIEMMANYFGCSKADLVENTFDLLTNSLGASDGMLLYKIHQLNARDREFIENTIDHMLSSYS